MDKVAVITTINYPTETIQQLEQLGGWRIVVVGDRKTPNDWSYKNVHYLSPTEQMGLGYKTTKDLPWNHYSRKMVGYIYAIRSGASIIADLDDDNVPYADWGKGLSWEGNNLVAEEAGFLNVYKYFTEENELVWPRGYPLGLVREGGKIKHSKRDVKVGVWQHLADGDPDVDAIYRLIINKGVTFQRKPPLVLDEGVVCPFNSQNTFFSKPTFPLLFLPPHVSFRFTDILRGIVAQPAMWAAGYRLGFGHSTVVQKRNPHDYMDDFILEVPMYQHVQTAYKTAVESMKIDSTVEDNVSRAYKALEEKGIVSTKDRALLDSWLRDIEL